MTRASSPPGRPRPALAALHDLLVGGSAAIARLRADVAQVAPSCATVLITGPTGAGKENVARALHLASGRTGRFVAINCGAIPADLAESELFGTETGAYTGATRPRAGRIEAANGGTLFLDEIAELPPALQVKLLRVLETGEVERLGGHRSIRVDVRVVAATHRDLDQMVADGRFRADLFWRLAVVCLDVPPLAARPDDIPALVAHFAAWRGAALELAEDGHAALRAHPWPGNVRELRNLVDRAVAYGVRRLDAEAVCRFLAPRRRTVDAWLTTPPDPAHPLRLPHDPPLKPAAELRPVVLKALLAEAEAAIIRQALDATGGTVARSARLLGMKRTTLIDRIRRLGLSDGPPAGNA